MEDRYEVSLGEGTLDLSAIDLAPGEELPIDVTVGVGHLVVLVPDGLAVDVTTKVSVGESQVLGVERNGVGISTDELDDEEATGGTNSS